MRWPLLLLAACATSAAAQTQTQLAGFELERLELDPFADASLVAGSARLLPPGAFRIAAALAYANAPLQAVRNGVNVGSVVRDRVTVQLTGAFALNPRLELGIAIPVVVMQLGDDLTAYGIARPSIAGLGSPWLIARTSIAHQDQGLPFDLGGQLGVAIPLGTPDALASSPGFVIAPRLIASRDVAQVRITAEAGASVRPLVPLGVEELGPAIELGAAGRWLAPLWQGLQPEGALRLKVPLTSQPVSFEVLAGARRVLAPRWTLFALLGFGIGRAPGTPRFLVSAGASFD